MIGGRKTRSNKGKKRTPYGHRRIKQSRTTNNKVREQANRVANAVKRVKDAKYKLQLEQTAKAVQRVKDAKYKLQLEKTAKAVQMVKNTVLSKRKRKVRSNKGKKRTPYGPRSRTRSGKKFRGRV